MTDASAAVAAGQLRARGISWVGVKTGSFRSMRDFFADVAGLHLIDERADFAVFRLPDGDKLEIFGPDAGEPVQQFAQQQVVASLLVEDIDEAIGVLRAAGIELVGARQGDGKGYFWQHFRAPDGKIFELVSDPVHP
jgi:predicted enzyme related to lactoylglutathione lyase